MSVCGLSAVLTVAWRANGARGEFADVVANSASDVSCVAGYTRAKKKLMHFFLFNRE